ncbi:MAG: hypothetical protein EPO21_01560 [Chloroflexota bacterium]|nr:MAG: hypothetical protein EPO21_01560 [Chloroflexota bacterium]
MANKRPPLSFPELDPKGRRAILRSAEEVRAEEQALENHIAGMPARGQDNQQSIQYEVMPANQPASSRSFYPKATYRLDSDAIEAVDEIKRLLRRQFGIKISLAQIVEEAILATYRDLLDNQHASKLVKKFAGTSANRNTSSRS